MDAAVKLEARLVNCCTAHINLALFLEAVRPAAEYAAARGVVITLENEAHDGDSPDPDYRARGLEPVKPSTASGQAARP